MRWSERPAARALRVEGEVEQWLSAGELDDRTRSVAGALFERGVRRGDRVCWQADSTTPAVLAALGVVRLGAVLVPVSASQSELERRTVLEDIAPTLVVAQAGSLQVPGWSVVDPASLRAEQASLVAENLAADELALVIYTSGTTGRPKGAMLTHGNLSAGIGALVDAWELSGDDQLVSALPLFHVHGLVAALLGVLTAGGAVELHARFEAASFLEATAKKDATLAFCVPTMLHRMAATDPAKLRGLRLLVSGSAPLSVSLFDELRRSASQSILERYGMTETLLTTSNPLHGERRPGTVGLALPGVLLDAPAPSEEPRELRVSGPTVFAGYWNRPEATAEVLHDGWMDTGDLVSVDDHGYVVVCGRSKELIITGGFNVYPSEVEDALRGRWNVVDAAVIGRPSAEWGEEVVAVVVLDGSGSFDEAALRQALANELSSYKVPRRIEVTTELPRNSLGKLQRHLL